MFGETDTATLTVETFRDLVAEHAAPQVPLPQNPGTRVEDGRLVRGPAPVNTGRGFDILTEAHDGARAQLERIVHEEMAERDRNRQRLLEQLNMDRVNNVVAEAPRPIWGAFNERTIEETDMHTDQATGRPVPGVMARAEMDRGGTEAPIPAVPYTEIKVAYGTGHQWIYRTPDYTSIEVSTRIRHLINMDPPPILHLANPAGEDTFISLTNVTGISVSRKQGGRF
jgi:hypothetical protein